MEYLPTLWLISFWLVKPAQTQSGCSFSPVEDGKTGQIGSDQQKITHTVTTQGRSSTAAV